MLRAVLNKAALEASRMPVSQPTIKKPPTPPTTTAGPQQTPSTSSVVITSSPVCLPLIANVSLTKSSVSGERGQHNPVLTSLLESDAAAPVVGTEKSLDVLQRKRTNQSDMMTAVKRQASVDDALNVSAALTRPAAPFRANTTPPISRSYSVPVQNCIPRPSIKVEPVPLLSFSNTKPLMSTPADLGQDLSTPRSSTSELINLLSGDFVSRDTNMSDVSCENQFDFNGSLKSMPSVPAVAVASRASTLSVDWSNFSSVAMSVDWETSSTVSDDLRQKSVTSKNSQIMRNSLPAGGIKTEPTTVHDGATVGLVAARNKPPITVKFSRHILKPAPQRRSVPDSDSSADRAAAKEHAKAAPPAKLNATMPELATTESLDFEVNSLTSVVSSIASSSPGRSSASPRLPGGGTGPPPEMSKPGEKRPRVIGNKLIGVPAEKKRRSDEGKKMSRKIYEFDDDNDVFVSGGNQSGKISTIKITKSEGRLQIQKSGTVAGPGSRPVHKSMSSSGQVSGSAVRLGRPPGFPLRPVVRSKSMMTPKSDSKGLGLPVVRTKPSPTVVSSGGIMLTSPSISKVTVANTTKSSTNSSAGGAKSKVVQSNIKRKGSLSAVIEKLSKGVSAEAVPDKKLYDDIRLAIIREGNKPSTPTREMSSSSSSLLSKSNISIAKRPDMVKESSARLTAPIRKPVSSGSQVADVARSQAAVVRFTAPPASPPSAATEQRPPQSLFSDVQVIPKISREQTAAAESKQLASSIQSLRPSVAVSRLSDVELSDSVGRGTTPVMHVVRPPVTCTVPSVKSSPSVSSETIARTKTPDAYIGRGIDPPTSMLSVETSEEISERFHPPRHFMDAMAHSSRVCASNVVERRLSPPRSPSPPASTIQPGTLDHIHTAIINTSDSNRTSPESVTGSVSGTHETSNLPVDLSADSGVGSRQPETLAGHFHNSSDASLRSSSTRSPSGTGSPVASLIIDCFPGSPVLMSSSNAVSSPVTTSMSDTATSLPSDTDDSSRADMCQRQLASPVTSIGETASADIDDDLMNEALMMSADVSNDQLGKL